LGDLGALGVEVAGHGGAVQGSQWTCEVSGLGFRVEEGIMQAVSCRANRAVLPGSEVKQLDGKSKGWFKFLSRCANRVLMRTIRYKGMH
jgi:hypothetical protein